MSILIRFLIYFFVMVDLVLIYCSIGHIAVIMGYMPNPVGYLKTASNLNLFYPYEEIGDKKWIAPWKFVVPIGFMELIYFKKMCKDI